MWVVYSDFGLNGAQVHGIYSKEPDADRIQEWATSDWVNKGGIHFCAASTTGYGGTFVEEFEVDGHLKLGW